MCTLHGRQVLSDQDVANACWEPGLDMALVLTTVFDTDIPKVEALLSCGVIELSKMGC